MSLWQLAACVEGWNRAQGNEPKPEVSNEEYDDILERHAEWVATVH
jgi:hypothetical protein